MGLGIFGAFASARRSAKLKRILAPHFDAHYYLHTNPDVAVSGMDALDHFIAYGWQEDRRPRSDFDPRFYVRSNPDLPAGSNPFVHYIRFGIAEGRKPINPDENNTIPSNEALNEKIEALDAQMPGLAVLRADVERLQDQASSAEVSVGRRLADMEALLSHHMTALNESKLAEGKFANELGNSARRLAEMEELLSRQATGSNASKLADELGKSVLRLEQRQCVHDEFVKRLDILVAGLLMRPRELAKRGPLVSIIMPTRDREKFICQAVDSVLGQLYEDWELIIVDDASNDGTPELIARYKDSRIRYTRLDARSGAAATRNIGLKSASGEIVAYLDDDNVWFPEYLAGAVAAYKADPHIQSAYGIVVRDPPEEGLPHVLWHPFDRSSLLNGNFIDLNAFTHRRALVEQFGGFDESLSRLIDWDLVLKYTQASSAVALPVPAARYRSGANDRISTSEPFAYATHRVRSKWRPRAPSPCAPKVLYALYQYPQASETYIEAEMQFMRRLGVRIEVWSQASAATPYRTDTPVHRESLEKAIDASAPDLIHVHWLNSALDFAEVIKRRGIPITARAHGFEVNSELIGSLLSEPLIKRVFLYSHQAANLDLQDPRLALIRMGFDETLFSPNKSKDPYLVVRASAGLPSKQLGFFVELAKRLPDHRFVLAVIACSFREAYIGELLEMRTRLDSPIEILVNRPHREMAELVGKAGIYLHTLVPPGEPNATPIGQPISIAEAMASGCYVLTRDLPPLRDYVGDAGAGYQSLEDAERLIRTTTRWSETEWRQAYNRSVDRAWTLHTPESALSPIYNAWLETLGRAA